MKKKITIDNSARIAQKLKEYSEKPSYMVLNELKTRQRGLDDFEIMIKTDECGFNEISREKPKPWYVHLFFAFINPFTFVLIFLSIVSFFTDVFFAAPGEKSIASVFVISMIVMISGTLRFFQERRSSFEAQNLKSMVKTTCTVNRNSHKQEIDMRELGTGRYCFPRSGGYDTGRLDGNIV